MKSKNFLQCLAASIPFLLLAGCQTTPNNSFSEWQEKPLANTRFNVPTVSTIPVTKLEQSDRNNGQVQNDRLQLACGQGMVMIEYTFDVWFTQQTETALADESKFRATFNNSELSVGDISPITSNANGKAVGYYGNASLNGQAICKVAKFGVRAKKGRKIYDNDRGGIDTVVTAFYCGLSEFDLERFTHNIALVEDKEAYGASIANLDTPQCKAKTSASLFPENISG
jgi:hypothetical protein